MSVGGLNTKKSRSEIRDLIRGEFRLWSIEDFDILPPLAGAKEATVEWWDANQQKRTARCSRWQADSNSYEKNLHACWQMIEAFRKADQRGMLQEFAQAAAGLLEAPGARPQRPWYEVLCVSPAAPEEVVKASYNALAKQAHPDHGGSDAAMSELNEALEQARGERGFE